ncbi:hypothetical protein ES695_06480 [Candidatus Atribacteria bacterium 1244-E10-H5-B2]|nr:MAG: hypothetical protein ES695_06480 [Candidatus Atribacteria bacterium 1244-E10-H5-B2]
MKIKFNPTGAHIRKGKLLIRLDLYPDSTYKTYALQYIDVFARELTEEEKENIDGVLTEKAKELQKLVPTKKQLNPFLCHFIAIDPKMRKKQLSKYIKKIFDTKTLTKLDDILSVDSKKDELCPVMKNKFGNEDIRVDENKINVEDINNQFTDFKVVL